MIPRSSGMSMSLSVTYWLIRYAITAASIVMNRCRIASFMRLPSLYCTVSESRYPRQATRKHSTPLCSLSACSALAGFACQGTALVAAPRDDSLKASPKGEACRQATEGSVLISRASVSKDAEVKGLRFG